MLIVGGDEGEDDDEGRFFGGGLNSEQNVSLSECGMLLKLTSSKFWISLNGRETRTRWVGVFFGLVCARMRPRQTELSKSSVCMLKSGRCT